MPLPDSVALLIAALAKLPGIGPRSAERIALYLVQADSEVVKHLAQNLLTARERVRFCELCGSLTEVSLNGIEPEDLRIAQLEKRLSHEPVQEVIIALGSDVEGDATSYYLAKRLTRDGLKVTRIAHGLPAGSGLEYADEITLSRALEGRRELS